MLVAVRRPLEGELQVDICRHLRQHVHSSPVQVSDLHYWGVVPVVETPLVDGGGDIVDKGEIICAPCGVADVDDEEDQPSFVWGANPQKVPEEEVSRELALCKCLVSWNPWEEPTDDLVQAMQTVAPGATAAKCTLRTQVVEQIAHEMVPMLNRYLIFAFVTKPFFTAET